VNRADVVFVLDSSGSIDRPNFRHMLNFVSQLVDSMDVDGGQIRVGLVAYADDIQPAFNLSQYSSRQAIQVCVYCMRVYDQYNTIQYNTIQYNTIQYNTIQLICWNNVHARNTL